jgi:beta-glucosidase
VIAGTNHSWDFDTESSDRKDIRLPFDQDELIAKVVAANPRTVVVIISGGAVEMPWLDHVPAVLEAWYPGMEGGNAVAAALFGDVNPGGKLPCTYPRHLYDSPPHALDSYPGENGKEEYREGLLVGYRWFDTRKIEPLFCFGHGLSYTTFGYANQTVALGTDSSQCTVEFDLTNTGSRDGAEVAQVYVEPINPAVDRPVKELKGFQKVPLAAGQTAHVVVQLSPRAFAHYEPKTNGWVADKGKYRVHVGSSSRDIRSSTDVDLRETMRLR